MATARSRACRSAKTSGTTRTDPAAAVPPEPDRRPARRGAELLLNASASPFVVGKHEFRLQLFGSQVKHFGKPLVYVNQVGGNDELVFDGNSCAFDAKGNVIAQAKDFEEDLLVVDESVTRNRGPHVPLRSGRGGHPSSNDYGHRIHLQRAGPGPARLRPQVRLQERGAGPLRRHRLGPHRRRRRRGAGPGQRRRRRHAKPLQLRPLRRPTRGACGEPRHRVPHRADQDDSRRLRAARSRPSSPATKPDVTEENLQARVRGALLMAFSNKFNHLLLTTGNKSEIAVGYCTLYGDMCGGLAVISDVPKTIVYELSRIRSTASRPRPHPAEHDHQAALGRAAAEPDRPGFAAAVRRARRDPAPVCRGGEERRQIIAAGFDAATVTRVIKLIDRSEYKRRQAAPGLKVTSRAFGFGRRMPSRRTTCSVPPRHGEPSPVEDSVE